MIMLNQSIKTKQNYVAWIVKASLFILKLKDFYKNIADDIEKCFDSSNYDDDVDRPLPIGKNKKKIGLFKDELGGKIMK